MAALGRSWPLLAALGALVAALGLLLGRSWALLGGSWGALGRSWGDLGTTCENHQKIDAKNDRFWLPKAPPNGTKIALKSDQKSMKKTKRKKRSDKIPSWNRLGAMLGRFGSPFGVIFIDFPLVFKAFLKIHVFQKITFQEPS